MITVKQLLESKPQNVVYSVSPDQMVIEALELMSKHNIGAVPVLENQVLVGIFSERDYARKGIIQGRKAKSTPVAEVMTPGVYTVTLRQNIDDCMQIMSERRIRHLPVMDHDRVCGVLSIGDIVNTIIREQEDRIQSLELYITQG